MNIKYAKHYIDNEFKTGDIYIFQPDKLNDIRLKNKIGKQCKIESVNGYKSGIKSYVVSFFVDMWQQDKEYYVVKETDLELHPNFKNKKEMMANWKKIDPYGEENWMGESINESLNFNDIEIGDILIHPVLGEGVVTAKRSDGEICRILFKRDARNRDIRISVVPDMYKKGNKNNKEEKGNIKWYKKGKLYDEEDWTNENINEKLKVGDVCTLINGNSIGINGKEGEKCTITRVKINRDEYDDYNEYYIKFPGTDFKYTCFRRNLIPIEEINLEIDKKRKEISKKMIDVDPYEEEDWLSERKIAYKKELNPKLWEDGKLIPRISEKLMRIARDFYNDLEIDDELLDVYLTGSIANYNYNADSDIDVHLIVDFSEINEDIELVKKALDGERYGWNIRHNIIIQGHDVEIYVQDVNEKHASSGVYSIMNDKWIKKPVYSRPNVDQVDVDNKYDARDYDITRFEKLSKQNLDPEEAEEYYKSAKLLKKKIQKSRSEGLDTGGEFSIENLVFKKLRKTGKFGKLIDSIGRFYDKIYSQ